MTEEMGGVTKFADNTDKGAVAVFGVLGLDLLTGVTDLGVVDFPALGVVMGEFLTVTTPPGVVFGVFLLLDFVTFATGVMFLAGRDSCAIVLDVTGTGDVLLDFFASD